MDHDGAAGSDNVSGTLVALGDQSLDLGEGLADHECLEGISLLEPLLGGTAVGDHIVVLALLVLGLEAVVGHGLTVSGELHGEVSGVQLASHNLTLGINGDDGGGDGDLALTVLVLGGIGGGGGCGVDTQTHLQGLGSLVTADECDGGGEHENAENNADKLFHEYSPCFCDFFVFAYR